jgi:hypothetical protein
MTIALLVLALATSSGFRVPDGAFGPPKVVCATSLPQRSGLYCASPFVKPHTYDGLGVLRLSPTGTVTTIQGGNDILLAIDGDLLGRTRPILRTGHSWSANGYRCARTATAVRCRRGTHSLAITLGR